MIALAPLLAARHHARVAQACIHAGPLRWGHAVSRLLSILILVFGLVAAGTASVVAQQTQPTARETIERSKESAAERARTMGPELKALRDEMTAQVGELRALVDKKVDEAGHKAMTFAIWAAVGFFALMVLASVLGGVIVALLFRRNRA